MCFKKEVVAHNGGKIGVETVFTSNIELDITF